MQSWILPFFLSLSKQASHRSVSNIDGAFDGDQSLEGFLVLDLGGRLGSVVESDLASLARVQSFRRVVIAENCWKKY